MRAASPTSERLLDLMSRAAVEPEAWIDLQYAVRDFMGARAVQLASVDHQDGNRFWSQTTDAPELDAQIPTIMQTSEPVLYAARNPRWRRFYDYIDEAGIAKSDFYHENRKVGYGYRLALRLRDTPGLSQALVVLWRPEQGHPQAGEFARLNAIEGQLRLVAQVSALLGEGLAMETNLLAGFEAMRQPALLVEGDGRVLLTNPAAEAILRERNGLACRAGKLELDHPGAAARLAALLASAHRAAEGSMKEQGGTLLVPRRSGSGAHVLTIVPLARRHRHLLGSSGLILVVFGGAGDVGPGGDAARIAAIAALYRLTEAEAAVCALFLHGRSIPAISAERAVGVGTVRQQVKSIMAKLGVERQAELMRALAGATGRS